MSWSYHFVSLSEDEKLHRRELLDLRGHYAQSSIVLAILAVRAFRFAQKSTTKRDAPALGNTRRYLLCGAWLVWLLGLCVWGSGQGMSLPLGLFGLIEDSS